MKSDIPNNRDAALLKESLRLARREPDADTLRRYLFAHVWGDDSLEPLSPSELRWVELNVKHHPRWRACYRDLVRSQRRWKAKMRSHPWMQLAILVAALIPLGLDFLARANHADPRASVEAAHHALVVYGEPHARVATGLSSRPSNDHLGRLWKAARLAPDPDVVADLWRGLVSTYNEVTEPAVKTETAYLLGELAAAYGDTTAAVLWYRRTLRGTTTRRRGEAHASLQSISVQLEND